MMCRVGTISLSRELETRQALKRGITSRYKRSINQIFRSSVSTVCLFAYICISANCVHAVFQISVLDGAILLHIHQRCSCYLSSYNDTGEGNNLLCMGYSSLFRHGDGGCAEGFTAPF